MRMKLDRAGVGGYNPRESGLPSRAPAVGGWRMKQLILRSVAVLAIAAAVLSTLGLATA